MNPRRRSGTVSLTPVLAGRRVAGRLFVRFIHELPMNYEDDRAEIGFARGFLEGVPCQWIRPTENKCLGEFKNKRGIEHICE